MIVVLYGQSLSGKTTIANALRRHLEDCPARHCGEVVKARAKVLLVPFGDLPYEEHRAIDADTRVWIEAQPHTAIVEGRYLHYVLSRTRADIRVIEIVCDEAARAERWEKRMGRALRSDELNNMDTADREFAQNMYPEFPPLVPGLRVDTKSATVDECVQLIGNWLSQN
jgi:cytidylate kinase